LVGTTSRHLGNICKSERKLLVERHVQGCSKIYGLM
jgi:hypothetical protein